MLSVKQGSSLRVALKADSQEEWNSLFPADYVIGQIRFGTRRFELEVTVDSLSRAIYVKGDTENWPIGTGLFDIKLVAGDLIQSIPELTNIEVEVVEGITQ